ncbi:MAG TPA: NADH-quinone oxidoreductase subunit L [Gammaproteobacteria bacterium]|jgi:NADH-quinone oxidoreductase subunit L|nr:NADH-quinone oxidoreductase subunit L [Gammaproteobacteria bacterium]
MESIYLIIPLAPLLGAIIAGLFGAKIGRAGAHTVTTLGVGIAFICSVITFNHIVLGDAGVYNATLYQWAVTGNIGFQVGFLIDNLTTLMMIVVTFVSLMVHIYTIGYMSHDEENWPDDSLAGRNSYQRFFSYISLFTFSMLMLVMSNNFMQLFFGWEAVGLVSYLLIGFWSTRDTAVYANMKAFLVNRVGDFGFLLGIATVLMYFGSLDYATVFGGVDAVKDQSMNIVGDHSWSVITVACILLFIGAMGKSAQIPLHVWLPDSMEGPTPISALIHAATMVTAGIFMVARMSPLFEHSETALSFILIIGSLTAFLMGLIGIVQNDIKRVVAYSTLSQLGYMTVGLGASAYAASIFHLMTHAFFKALLFLAAGSVIIAMHHVQDIRKMGGLKKYMPITYWTSLIGSLALIGFPGFAGFFSKDSIIESVHASQIPGATFAYWMVLAGVFITAFYSFRMFFLVFHTEERMDEHTRKHLKETPWVVTLPLILLAIPSVFAGYLIDPIVVGDFFKGVIYVDHHHEAIHHLTEHYHGVGAFILHGLKMPPFWLAISGLGLAWFIYTQKPEIAAAMQKRFSWLHALLLNKYGFDDFNERVFARGSLSIGNAMSRFGDGMLIEGTINGGAKLIALTASIARHVQTGYLYHYSFAMILGLIGLLGWFVLRAV